MQTTVTPPCEDFINADSMMVTGGSCIVPIPVCIDLPYIDRDSFSMTVNGSPYNSEFEQCIDDPDNIELSLIAGEYEIIIRDENTTCTDTINLRVTCITSEIILDTIYEGTIDSICLDLSELSGNPVSITNDCPDESGVFVSFETQDDSYCVVYEGLDIGEENACIIACDDQGICDTTYMTITVLPSIMLPDANDDIDTTSENTTITINVMANDFMFGDMDTIYVDNPPANGTVTYNGDGTFNYEPNEGYCSPDEGDSFTYVICDELGCDTAMVTIYILCDELVIYTGFSPNNDNINETFQILGLEGLPENNNLIIFNRWGNQVFNTRNYQNDWRGTWNGKDLPDGTYFYVFNDGRDNIYSGYIQLHR